MKVNLINVRSVVAAKICEFNTKLSKASGKCIVTCYQDIDNNLEIKFDFLTKKDINILLRYFEKICLQLRCEAKIGSESPQLSKYKVICDELSKQRYRKLFVKIKIYYCIK